MIADVPKTMVYRVARWLNETRGRPMIPEPILTKAPSAELRPNQTDQDSLPPYDVLDDILQRHIERHQPADEIVAAGFDAATVTRVLRLVRAAEFKRKQAAPGLKVTDRAFGTGWRMPIAAASRLARSRRPLQVRYSPARCPRRAPPPVHPQPQLRMPPDVHLEHVGASLRELADGIVDCRRAAARSGCS